MKVSFYTMTDIGRVREENQDAYLIAEDINLFLVADGMGGMDRGKEAALFTVESVADYIRKYYSNRKNELIKLMSHALSSTGANFFEVVGEGSGSTVVAAILTKKKAVIANLGDSSAYLLRKGQFSLLTKEHNLANLLVEGGRLNPAQAKEHHTRHQLTAFIGMKGKLPVHVAEFQPNAGDRLLLCSDGLNGLVFNEVIEDVLKMEPELKTAAHRLVDLANEAGGYDNTTVMLVDVLGVDGE